MTASDLSFLKKDMLKLIEIVLNESEMIIYLNHYPVPVQNREYFETLVLKKVTKKATRFRIL